MIVALLSFLKARKVSMQLASFADEFCPLLSLFIHAKAQRLKQKSPQFNLDFITIL
jgi:hypothetical protein